MSVISKTHLRFLYGEFSRTSSWTYQSTKFRTQAVRSILTLRDDSRAHCTDEGRESTTFIQGNPKYAISDNYSKNWTKQTYRSKFDSLTLTLIFAVTSQNLLLLYLTSQGFLHHHVIDPLTSDDTWNSLQWIPIRNSNNTHLTINHNLNN